MTLSLTGRHWQKRGEMPDLPGPRDLASALRDARGLSPVGLLNGETFTDYQKLIARLEKALAAQEKIGIVGDYDCDGVTSTALWIRALRRRGAEPFARLPHRMKEGYGLRMNHIGEMAGHGVTLLLTVDNGVTAHKEIEEANRRGIDVCVIDHHHVSAMPAALAIIHPDRGQVTAAPAAATLSFAVIDAWQGHAWKDRNTDLALAAIGTVADVMPLIAENRTLVEQGLIALRSMKTGPLKELMDLSGITACTARDIAFGLAPRINAAGRMDDPVLALEALLSGGAALRELCRLNSERRTEVEEHLDTLTKTILNGRSSLPLFLFALSDEFSPGTVGLLAGKLTEQTGRPSLVGAIQGDSVTASLRSPAAYHVTQGLERAEKYLMHFGGHAQAAGCSFLVEDADDLHRALLADATLQSVADSLLPTHAYDATLKTLAGLSFDTVQDLSSLEPFGSGNPEPRFVLPAMTFQSARRIGKEATHLQAVIDGIPAVGFGLGAFADTKTPVDVLCRLTLNTWNGKTTLQAMIEDLRAA